MFHFPGFPPYTYVFSIRSMALRHRGCPIRRSAAELICSWPQLIAACHVLLRLLMPRHSPYALVRLNFLHRSFDLCCSLNCLSFFVHISVCNKKALLFHRFVFVLRFHARRNCVFTLLCWKTNISQYYVLNICSFLLFSVLSSVVW